jgi:hypothetical protein
MPHRLPTILLASLISGLVACGTGTVTEASPHSAIEVIPKLAYTEPLGQLVFRVATAAGTSTEVTWMIAEAGGGTVGSTTGSYAAPASEGIFHVVATSVADASVRGSALVTVSRATSAGYSIPSDRITNWTPGVPGGVPNYTVRYGSTLAAGASTSTIQAALNAAGTAAAADGVGRVVQLGPGLFTITSSLNVPSKVVLRGAGPNSTQLVASTRSTSILGMVLFGQTPWPNASVGPTNLTVDALKGSSTITVASVSGLSVGMLIHIDELTDDTTVFWETNVAPLGTEGKDNRNWFCRWNRPKQHIGEIAAISGSTITLTRPLHIGFRTAYAAQLTRFNASPTKDAGVEDLRLSNAGQSGADSFAVQFAHSQRCWAKHIEADGIYGRAIVFNYALQAELRDSYIHDAHVMNNGGFAYGTDVMSGSTDCLIENNIVIRWNKVVNMRASGGGNVFAYNYTDDGAMMASPGWVETGIQASHYPCPHYVLFEGNYSFNADGEFTWGNAIYITFYRNHLSGARRFSYDSKDLALTNSLHPLSGGTYLDSGNVRMAGAMRRHYWYNFVGNVLGLPAVSYAGWLQDDRGPWSAGDKAIWRIGVWDQDYTLNDTQVGATMLRDGNFDYKSNTVQWNGIGESGGTADTLPDSLYLRAKPAFFGSSPWPWVDPVGLTKTATLPAKARYDAGTPND